ncbi:HDOD domain-containing protein [Fusibacter bizertensis]|uniref:HDOD domain-containing protein n=1 Tax=Fusibacter bizertensis TaxID=1488331 RepID=A0ABT6NBF4_9FIRM|nr:HDOD domain-containing protein [Fusibacter bizertensis]MDH8677747.1 HDOD domain-containing protein [Fusibacter bizertensis]
MYSVLIISKDNEYVRNVEYKISSQQYTLSHTVDLVDALSLMEGQDVDIVIVDSESEESDKAILTHLKNAYPKVIRFCVSSIQSNSDHYLPKKMNNSQIQCNKNISIDELFSLIEKVLEIDAKVKDKDLVNLMSNLKHLPTVPQVYNQMTNMIMNNASVEEIANKLEEDPAITSNILKLANTAFYNAKTGSIRQAIMYIGLINVKNIILTNAVFGNDGLDPKTRDLHWEHVMKTNKILNAFYIEVLGKKLNNNISSVGLLHDIGSIVLMSNFPKKFDGIVKAVQENSTLRFHDLEEETFGFNHEQLGGHLLDLWGLPYPVIEAALFHHDPLNPKLINQELVKSVHLANYYAWKSINYTKYDNYLVEEVFESLGITKLEFENFFNGFIKKI